MKLSGTVYKAKTIPDLFRFNLVTFFYGDYQEVYSDDQEGIIMVDYLRTLDYPELNIFDTVKFRVFSDKKNIVGSNHINASLTNDKTQVGKDKVRHLLERILEVCGNDDRQKGVWTENDDYNFVRGKFSRFWTLGRELNMYSVQLLSPAAGKIELRIYFFNNLMKQTGAF